MPAHSARHRHVCLNFRVSAGRTVRVGSWEWAHFKLEGSPDWKCLSHLPTVGGRGSCLRPRQVRNSTPPPPREIPSNFPSSLGTILSFSVTCFFTAFVPDFASCQAGFHFLTLSWGCVLRLHRAPRTSPRCGPSPLALCGVRRRADQLLSFLSSPAESPAGLFFSVWRLEDFSS